MVKFFKKYHKWIGIVLTIFILLFSISGIILNHRSLFSWIDVSRNFLPKEYHYNKWNNAAVRGAEKINIDSILFYGNIGLWLTDSSFTKFNDFNAGLPNGIDNRKISKVFKTSKGNLFAGTFFGLFQYHYNKNLWQKVNLPIDEDQIVDIAEKGDTLLVISRSYLLKTKDFFHFTKVVLPEPENYDNKTGLFKTLWMIHSGEIFGLIGKMIVDIIGLVFIFLSITGLIYFINPFVIKRKNINGKNVQSVKKSSKWNLKWHNKIGCITVVFLLIITSTGVLLRPPLLIPIAGSKVNKIPYTILDSENPWFDKLRRINYDDQTDRYIIATIDGFYYSEDNFSSKLKKCNSQPPISVMGVNVFEQISDSVLLVGSFEGLFTWNTYTGLVQNYMTKQEHKEVNRRSVPIGSNVITGYTKHFKSQEVYFDYNSGAKLIGTNQKFVPMPLQIEQQPMSLWNLALEVHTARIYKSLFGNFYILIIPISGLLILFILISGFFVWNKNHIK